MGTLNPNPYFGLYIGASYLGTLRCSSEVKVQWHSALVSASAANSSGNFLKYGNPNIDPNIYSPHYGDPQTGIPNSGKPPSSPFIISVIITVDVLLLLLLPEENEEAYILSAFRHNQQSTAERRGLPQGAVAWRKAVADASIAAKAVLGSFSGKLFMVV